MKLNDVNHVAIIGTGMIGASMATMFTGNGYKTTLYAINDQEAANGLSRYRTIYNDLIDNGLVTRKQADACEALLSITQDYADIADADFIFECVVENKDVKFSVYAEIEKHCHKFRALASSTSAMSPEDLCKGLKENAHKLVGAHPWNPPHLVPCVEVVRSSCTSDDALDFCVKVLESVGRKPAVMKKAAPGFIANRLQHAILREAVYMIETGICDARDIDSALTYSFMPRYTSIGFFEHQDNAGLDMVLSIDDYLFPDLCTAQEAQDFIRSRCEKGELGIKTGKGIYDWEGVDLAEFRKRAAAPYLSFFNWDLPGEE